jgi:F0F1-type ATP synthase delta subunit
MKKDISIYFDLITSLRTIREVDSLVCEIDSLTLSFFKSKKISIKKALDSISTELAAKIMEIFAKNNLDINNRDTVSGFFKTLKELTKKLKVIKLVLAFDPTNRTIENIHNFVKETVGVGYVLDIEISQDVLAGAIIMFNGKYSDFTLKKSIEVAFKTKNESIAQLMD